MTTRCFTLLEEARSDRSRRRAALDGSYWTPKSSRIDPVDDLEEDVLWLGELRVAPGPVLVVVLHAQHDVPLLGILERAADPVEGAVDPDGARQARIALPAERAAVAGAEPDGEVDGGFLTLDLAPALVGVGVREVGRETDHRRDLPVSSISLAIGSTSPGDRLRKKPS